MQDGTSRGAEGSPPLSGCIHKDTIGWPLDDAEWCEAQLWIEQQAGDTVISLALRKGPTGYADTVILVADSDPGYTVDSKVRVYGILEGLGAEGADSVEHSYPKLRVQNITLLEAAVPAAAQEAGGA